MGKGVFFKLLNATGKLKSALLKDADNKVCKLKNIWIIDENKIARQLFELANKVMATAAYSRSAGDKTSAATLSIKAQDSDNIVLTFPANSAFLTCEKLTLYINSKTASRTLKTIALRSGSTANSSMSIYAGIATPVPAYGITETGWQAIDVTTGFGDGGGTVTREQAAAEGIKIWLRTNSGTCTIAGINSDECPYLMTDFSASVPPVEPDTPTQNVAFVVQDDGSITVENVSFTQLSDGIVQIDNATFTQQDDGSVLVQ